jgi:hypothetical protein
MSEFSFELSQFPLPPRTHRLAQHRKPALARLPATVREAEEVEGVRCTPIATTRSIVARIAAKLDQSRLLGVQFQSKAREPLTQLGEEPLGLDSMLEPDDEASPPPLRTTTHDSGPVWLAKPSLYETSIHYTLPV